MKKATFLLLLLAPFAGQAQIHLEKLWETDTTQLRTPESVLWDPSSKSLYVSNIDGKPWEADGKGFISTLAQNGVVQTAQWATGLNAPKGMGISKGKLYVADLAEVAVIDLRTGKILRKIAPEGAKNLNDVAVGPDGDIYVTDSATSRIYVIKGNKAELYLENAEIQRPNGIRWVGKRLFVFDAGKGGFYEVNADKSLKKLAEGMPSGDGIEPLGDGFLLSRWAGIVHHLSADGKLTQVLDLTAEKKNTADIGFDPQKRILYIPTFNANSVVAYQVH
jgi:sugar lactone lactonase YvrE